MTGGLLKYVSLSVSYPMCLMIRDHTSWLMIGVSYLAYCKPPSHYFDLKNHDHDHDPYIDHGLKAQGLEGELRGIYRSRFQPYAAVWTITWQVFIPSS